MNHENKLSWPFHCCLPLQCHGLSPLALRGPVFGHHGLRLANLKPGLFDFIETQSKTQIFVFGCVITLSFHEFMQSAYAYALQTAREISHHL